MCGDPFFRISGWAEFLRAWPQKKARSGRARQQPRKHQVFSSGGTNIKNDKDEARSSQNHAVFNFVRLIRDLLEAYLMEAPLNRSIF
jgi:hypothetical protein